jgi:transposase
MQDPEIRGEIDLMCTFPGVSFISACNIIAELGSLKQYSARELSALSGLAPRIRESGLIC